MQEKNRKTLIKKACKNFVAVRDFQSAWIALVEDGGKIIDFAGQGGNIDIPKPDEEFLRDYIPYCLKEALKTDDIVLIEDMQSDCQGCPRLKLHKEGEWGAMSAGIKTGGKCYGVINVSLPTHYVTNKEYQSLFMEAAGDIAHALYSMELEEKRKQAEEKYGVMFEMAKDAVFLSDETGKFVDVNQMACESLGYSKEELLKLGNKEIDADPSGCEAFLKIRNGPEEQATFEVNQRRKDGTLLPVEITGSFFTSGGQRIALAIARNITERKKAEEKEKEHHKNIQLLSKTAMQLVEFPVDKNLYNFIGEQLKELIGKDSYIVINTIDEEKNILTTRAVLGMEKFIDKIAKLLGRHPVGMTFDAKDKNLSYLCDSKLHYYEEGLYGILLRTVPKTVCNFIEKLLNIKKIYGIGVTKDNELFGTVVIFLREGAGELKNKQLIETFIKQASIAVQKRQVEKALKESEEKYKTLYDSSRDAIMIFSSNTGFLSGNPATVKMFGFQNEDEFIFQTPAALSPEYQPDGALSLEKSQKMISIAMEQGSHFFEWKHKRIDGEEFHATVLLTRMKLYGKKVLQATVRDITKRKKLEIQLHQSQKMEAIGTLTGGIAHDFNNLLTVIIGNTQLALMNVIKDESLRKKIEETKKAGEKAASLTRQLLAFSRKQIIKPEVVDLNHVINETEKMLKRTIGEDIEFQAVLEPELWKVYVDPGQISQVIINMVVNARDAMQQGEKLIVETANADLDENYFREHGIKERGHYVMLAVSDTGSGMDKETMEHIFEPFFTTKEVGKGTGLGLSTVYGIVKQNNGFIWVYSEPGEGTTFKVYLPKMKENVEAEKKKETSVNAPVGSETVLIVEDDYGLLKLAQKVLQSCGYRILSAENGEEALKVGKEHEGQIDLMITDVVMPKMGGKKAVDRLQPLYPQMKVIYMSGYTDNAIVRHGVLAPGLNFLEKPFTPEGLARKVREALDGAAVKATILLVKVQL